MGRESDIAQACTLDWRQEGKVYREFVLRPPTATRQEVKGSSTHLPGSIDNCPSPTHMQSWTPWLARTVSTAKRPHTRIPHLNCHINERIHITRPRHDSQRQLRQSSILVDHQPFRDWDTANEPDGVSLHHDGSDFVPLHRSVTVDKETQREPDTVVHVNTEIDIGQLLQEACAHRVASWLGSRSRKDNREAFIRAADDASFNAAICKITPEDIVLPLRRVQKHVKSYAEERHSFKPRLLVMLAHYWDLINRILIARQEAGHPLSLQTIEHALRWTAAVGDLREARKLWKTLRTNQLTPSLTCYNEFMASYVNRHAFSHQAALSFRVTERNLQMRASKYRPPPYRGYVVDPLQPLHRRTLKAQCLSLFKEISQKQLSPNEETFVTLMTALARSGDTAAVSSILKSVWNIDVQQLDAFDEEEVESPTFYEESHPLRPSKKLLQAIVHAYCINNDTAHAWKLLDYTSRNYNLDIPDEAWEELFEWTFVMSIPRRMSQVERRGEYEGLLPPSALSSLIELMTDEPHNRQLSPVMRHLYSRFLRYQKKPAQALKNFRKSLNLLHESCAHLQDKNAVIEAMAHNLNRHIDNGILSQAFVQAKVELEKAFQDVAQQYQLLSQEAQNIISEPLFALRAHDHTWVRRGIPQAVEELHVWLDSTIKYQLPQGNVELEDWTEGHTLDVHDRFSQVYLEGLAIYRIISSSELQWIYQRLKDLPRMLASLRQNYDSRGKVALIEAHKERLRKRVGPGRRRVKKVNSGEEDNFLEEHRVA